MAEDNTTERLDALEAIVAEQQQIIDELSEMVTRQWDVIEQQKHKLAEMTDHLQDLEETRSGPANQKAPHY